MASTYSNLTNTVIQYLDNLNLQPLNKFEIVILPRLALATARQVALNTLATTLGNVMFKFHVQEVDIPFLEYEMETAEEGIKYIKDVKHPETFTVKFIDGEKGEAMRCINGWMALIGTPDFIETGGYGNVFNDKIDFAPDLQYMKLNILLKLIGGRDSGNSLLYPSILFRRAKPKKISNIKVSQESDDFMTFDVEFSVDQVLISNVV